MLHKLKRYGEWELNGRNDVHYPYNLHEWDESSIGRFHRILGSIDCL